MLSSENDSFQLELESCDCNSEDQQGVYFQAKQEYTEDSEDWVFMRSIPLHNIHFPSHALCDYVII